jgi:hypothetical protein
MNKLVTVTPKTKHAKNRFKNQMSSTGVCVVEQDIQRDGNPRMLFLRSRNGQRWFWVQVDNDPDWMVE